HVSARPERLDRGAPTGGLEARHGYRGERSSFRWGAPSVWGLGAISGAITGDDDRGAPRLCRGATSDRGVGGHFGAPLPVTTIEARHGFAGARRAIGGLGAISGPHDR